MAEQLYKEWFVRMRFPNYQNTKFVKGIPEGWEVKSVKFFGKVITGKTPSTSKPEYYGGDTPFIKTPDMHGNMFILKTEETLSEQGKMSQKNTTLYAGSICINCIGALSGSVSITTKTSQTNQQIHSLIPKSKENLEYLYFAMKGLKETIHLFGNTGSTMTNLSKGKFENLLLLCPNDNVVEQYHGKVKDIFQKITLLGSQNINLRQTRDLLLPRLISGKLSIKEAEKELQAVG